MGYIAVSADFRSFRRVFEGFQGRSRWVCRDITGMFQGISKALHGFQWCNKSVITDFRSFQWVQKCSRGFRRVQLFKEFRRFQGFQGCSMGVSRRSGVLRSMAFQCHYRKFRIRSRDFQGVSGRCKWFQWRSREFQAFQEVTDALHKWSRSFWRRSRGSRNVLVVYLFINFRGNFSGVSGFQRGSFRAFQGLWRAFRSVAGSSRI